MPASRNADDEKKYDEYLFLTKQLKCLIMLF